MSNLNNNTTQLEFLLAKINELPEAGSGDTENRYEEGYEAGKDETLYNFWYSYQNGGFRSEMPYIFAFMNSRDFYPLYDIKPTGTQANHMFRHFNNSVGSTNFKNFDLAYRLEECGVKLDFSSCTSVQLVYAFCKITHIPECDFSNCKTTDRCFYDISNLERIDKVIGGDNTSFYGTYGTSFYKLPALTYIRFGGTIGGASNIDLSGSPLLEVECFTNSEGSGLFDCLADKSNDTTKTWTCTIGATNLAKLTDAQKAIATEKGWTLA